MAIDQIEGDVLDATSSTSGVIWSTLLAVMPLALFAPYLWRFGTTAQDEGQLLAYPSLMLRGFWPNTDFVYVYGINNLLVLVGSFGLAGESLAVERLVGFVFRLVLIVLLTDMIRRVAGAIVASVAGIVAALVLVTTALPAYAWTNAVAVGVGAIWAASNLERSRWRVAEAVPWLIGGLAIGFRLDIAPAVVLGIIVGRGGFPRGRALVQASVGFVIGLSPLLAQMALGKHAIRDTIIDPILRGGGRRLPFVPDDTRLLAYSLLVLTSVVLIVVALVHSRRHAQTTPYRNMASLGVFAVMLLPQMYQRLDWIHVAYVACVILPAAIGAAAFMYQQRSVSYRPGRFSAVSISVVVFGVLFVTGFLPSLRWYVDGAWGFAVRGERFVAEVPLGEDRTVNVLYPDARELEAVVATTRTYISTNCFRLVAGPSDLRFAIYSDTFLHWLLPNTEPGSRFLEFNPGQANAADSNLADDLRSAHILILNDAYVDWNEPNSSRDPGPKAPNGVVEDRFREVGRFGSRILLVAPECL